MDAQERERKLKLIRTLMNIPQRYRKAALTKAIELAAARKAALQASQTDEDRQDVKPGDGAAA